MRAADAGEVRRKEREDSEETKCNKREKMSLTFFLLFPSFGERVFFFFSVWVSKGRKTDGKGGQCCFFAARAEVILGGGGG